MILPIKNILEHSKDTAKIAIMIRRSILNIFIFSISGKSVLSTTSQSVEHI